MDTLTPIQKLDIVLKFFATSINKENHNFLNFTHIEAYNELNLTNPEFIKQLKPSDEFRLIIEKLIEDNYVRPIDVYTETQYSITFNGRVFDQQGGYEQQMINETSEKNQLQALESFRHEQTETLNRLTCWIVVGTLIAAVYYLIELLKYFHILPPSL